MTTDALAPVAQRPPLLVATLIQGTAVGVALGVAPLLTLGALPIAAHVAGAGLLAAILSMALDQPRWWHAIHAVLPPAVLFATALGIAPLWYLAALGVLLTVTPGAFRERVPIYLSGREAREALLGCLPKHRAIRFLDLGSGPGGLVAHLAAARTDSQFAGVENAPLSWLVSRIRLAARANARVHRGDYWKSDLRNYDVVYAFLSPTAMPALWRKARQEMRSGTLLISNQFVIPGVPADEVVRYGSDRSRRMYLWRL